MIDDVKVTSYMHREPEDLGPSARVHVQHRQIAAVYNAMYSAGGGVARPPSTQYFRMLCQRSLDESKLDLIRGLHCVIGESLQTK